jgi:hypothetical protein
MSNPEFKIKMLNGGGYRVTSDECESVLCDHWSISAAYDGALRQLVDLRYARQCGLAVQEDLK